MSKAKPPGDPLTFIKICLTRGRVRWTYHVTMRLHQRTLNTGMLYSGMETLEIIESYPDDKYLPSFLLRGEAEDGVFHVQIATDVEDDNVRIVTMYTPDRDNWDEEFRRRRST